MSIQLLTRGPQDEYISGNPIVYFFKSVFKQYVNFELITEKIYDPSSPKPNSRMKIKIPKKYPLLSGIYIRYESSSDHNILEQFTKISLEIGGQIIQELTTEFLHINSKIIYKKDELNIYKDNIYGNYINIDINNDNTPSFNYFLKIPFFFNNYENTFPLYKIFNQEVNIIFQTEKTIKPLNNFFIYAEYINIDKTLLTKIKYDYFLIEQQQIRDYDISKKIDIQFKHPVKELMWVFRTEYKFQYGFNNIFKNLTLYANNVEISNQEDYYYNIILPSKYHQNTPNDIYIYSFSLNPENIFPTGTLNMSRLNSFEFSFDKINKSSTDFLYKNNNFTNNIRKLSNILDLFDVDFDYYVKTDQLNYKIIADLINTNLYITIKSFDSSTLLENINRFMNSTSLFVNNDYTFDNIQSLQYSFFEFENILNGNIVGSSTNIFDNFKSIDNILNTISRERRSTGVHRLCFPFSFYKLPIVILELDNLLPEHIRGMVSYKTENGVKILEPSTTYLEGDIINLKSSSKKNRHNFIKYIKEPSYKKYLAETKSQNIKTTSRDFITTNKLGLTYLPNFLHSVYKQLELFFNQKRLKLVDPRVKVKVNQDFIPEDQTEDISKDDLKRKNFYSLFDEAKSEIKEFSDIDCSLDNLLYFTYKVNIEQTKSEIKKYTTYCITILKEFTENNTTYEVPYTGYVSKNETNNNFLRYYNLNENIIDKFVTPINDNNTLQKNIEYRMHWAKDPTPLLFYSSPLLLGTTNGDTVIIDLSTVTSSNPNVIVDIPSGIRKAITFNGLDSPFLTDGGEIKIRFPRYISFNGTITYKSNDLNKIKLLTTGIVQSLPYDGDSPGEYLYLTIGTDDDGLTNYLFLNDSTSNNIFKVSNEYSETEIKKLNKDNTSVSNVLGIDSPIAGDVPLSSISYKHDNDEDYFYIDIPDDNNLQRDYLYYTLSHVEYFNELTQDTLYFNITNFIDLYKCKINGNAEALKVYNNINSNISSEPVSIEEGLEEIVKYYKNSEIDFDKFINNFFINDVSFNKSTDLIYTNQYMIPIEDYQNEWMKEIYNTHNLVEIGNLLENITFIYNSKEEQFGNNNHKFLYGSYDLRSGSYKYALYYHEINENYRIDLLIQKLKYMGTYSGDGIYTDYDSLLNKLIYPNEIKVYNLLLPFNFINIIDNNISSVEYNTDERYGLFNHNSTIVQYYIIDLIYKDVFNKIQTFNYLNKYRTKINSFTNSGNKDVFNILNNYQLVDGYTVNNIKHINYPSYQENNVHLAVFKLHLYNYFNHVKELVDYIYDKINRLIIEDKNLDQLTYSQELTDILIIAKNFNILKFDSSGRCYLEFQN